MKLRRLSLLSLLLLVLPLSAAAQRYEHKWEVNLSVGGCATTHFEEHTKVSPDLYSQAFINPDLYALYGEHAYTEVQPDWCTPTFGLEVGYSVKRWLKVSLTAGYDHVVTKTVDYSTQEVLFKDSLEEIAIIPRVRFYFGFTDYTCFYGGLGFGAILRWGDALIPENNIKKAEFAYEFVPIGFTVGRKVHGFIEASFGNYMLGGRTGIGVRF